VTPLRPRITSAESVAVLEPCTSATPRGHSSAEAKCTASPPRKQKICLLSHKVRVGTRPQMQRCVRATFAGIELRIVHVPVPSLSRAPAGLAWGRLLSGDRVRRNAGVRQHCQAPPLSKPPSCVSLAWAGFTSRFSAALHNEHFSRTVALAHVARVIPRPPCPAICAGFRAPSEAAGDAG
jgi:hypothetical protein